MRKPGRVRILVKGGSDQIEILPVGILLVKSHTPKMDAKKELDPDSVMSRQTKEKEKRLTGIGIRWYTKSPHRNPKQQDLHKGVPIPCVMCHW